MERQIKNHHGVRHKIGTLLLILAVIVGSIGPYIGIGSFASGNGLVIVSTLDKNELRPGEEATVKLNYSTANNESYFYGVAIDFELPFGAEFTGVVPNGHFNGPAKFFDKDGNDVTATPALTKRVQILLANSDDGALYPTQFRPGSSGSVEVKFKYNLPSVYANGTMVDIKPATITGNGGTSTEEDTLLKHVGTSELLTFKYLLDKSWTIGKTGPLEKVISNSPAQKTIRTTYTVKLDQGNIPLKNVVITDLLPADATYVSDTLTGQPGVNQNLAEAGKVIWTVDQVGVSGLTFDVVLDYAVKRDAHNGAPAQDGVVALDQRTNTVQVTGVPLELQSDGTYKENLTPEADAILTKEATATTLFKASTAKWGVDTSGETIKYITKNPTVTTINVNYRITVSGGDIDINNGVLVYAVPADITAVVDAAGGTYDPVAHTITWSGVTAAANTSIIKNLVFQYTIDRLNADNDLNVGVSHGSERENTVTMTAKDALDGTTDIVFVPDTDKVKTIFQVPTDEWRLTKSASGNAVVLHEKTTDEAQGSAHYDVTYTINLNGSEYVTPLKDIVIKDILPANASYISNTSGQEPVISGNELTWNFPTMDPPGVSFNLVVRYPIDRDGAGPDVGYAPVSGKNKAINQATSTGNKVDSSGNPDGPYDFGSRGNPSHTVTFIEAPKPTGSISININTVPGGNSVFSKDGTKLIQDKHFNKGEDISYEVAYTASQSNGEVLKNAEVTIYDLPADVQFKRIVTGKKDGSNIPYKLYYTVDGTNWILFDAVSGGNFNTSSSHDITWGALLPGVTIKGFKFDFDGDLPAGFSLTEKVKLYGTVSVDAANNRYDVPVRLDYQHREFEGISVVKNATDKVGFNILRDEAYISEMTKTKLTAPAFGNVGHTSNETIRYRLRITNHAGLGTKDLKDPVLVDVLPEGFEYKGNVTFSSSKGVDGLPVPVVTAADIKLNHPVRGKTTVNFKWPAGSVLKIGETITLEYDAKVESHASVGNHENLFYMYALDTYKKASSYEIVTDATLNPNAGNELLKAPPCITAIIETAAVNSVLWVKGELDSAYSKFPKSGLTVRGGIADYFLEVENDSNVNIRTLEIIDILPYINDTAVLNPNSARGTTWRPNMIQAIASGYVDGLVENVYGEKSKANLQVYYSTAKNPFRTNQQGQFIGAEPANWSLVPPTDMSTVQSLKFVVNDFEENGKADKLMRPGSKIHIAWKMRAPIDTLPGKVAWNSISQTATYVDYNNQTKVLLPAEPQKVGIEVQASVKGELGDFVWLDVNKNGLQDAGETGVNGVKAHLYKKVDGTFTQIATTLTGDNEQGKPGNYLFPNLDAGDYYVVFDIKGMGYEATKTRVGTNAAIDSNASVVGGILKTDVITLTNGQKNMTVDLGLFESNFVLQKSADRPNFSTIGTIITYTVTVVNNGPVDLTNVVVKDPLINLNETIPLLKVDETKTYTGTYTTIDKDVTAGKVINTASADSDQTAEIKATAEVVYTPPTTSGGGGGSGGGGTSTPVVPGTPVVPVTPLPTDKEPQETVEGVENRIPAGPADTNIDDDLNPLDAPDRLPKTGESSPIFYYVLSLILIGAGVYLRRS